MAQSQKKVDGGRIGGPVVVPNVMNIRVVWVFNNSLPSRRLASMNFQGFAAPLPSPTVAMANTILAGLAASVSGTGGLHTYMPADTVLGQVALRDMSLATNPEFLSTSAGAAGTDVANKMPLDVALVLTERIAARGRGLNGRAFFGGFTVTASDVNGVAVAGLVTALNNFGTALNAQITGQGMVACVAQAARQAYTGVTGTQHPQRNAGHITVQSYTTRDNVFDTQRRRNQV